MYTVLILIILWQYVDNEMVISYIFPGDFGDFLVISVISGDFG